MSTSGEEPVASTAQASTYTQYYFGPIGETPRPTPARYIGMDCEEKFQLNEQKQIVGGAGYLNGKFGTVSVATWSEGVPWCDDINWSISTCNNFHTAVTNNSGDRVLFHDNLHDKAAYFLDDADEQRLETVDLYYVMTHGNAWVEEPGGYSRTTGVLAMWNNNTLVGTADMRFGDEGRGLSIFAAHACYTMKMDGHLDERWMSAFRGGLRLGLGATGLLHTVKENANYMSGFQWWLRAGPQYSHFGRAWKGSLDKADKRNEPNVVASGRSPEECRKRLHDISYDNFDLYPRLSDDEVAYLCSTGPGKVVGGQFPAFPYYETSLPAHVAWRANAKTQFGGAPVVSRRRLPGPGREAMVGRLIAAFERRSDCGAGTCDGFRPGGVQIEKNEEYTAVTGRDWRAHVLGDGTSFEFRTPRPEILRTVTPEERLPNATVIAHARKWLDATRLVALGPGEDLVPLEVVHTVEALQKVGASRVDRSISETQVIFGRTLGGLPVVGHGSQIAVSMAVDGRLVAMTFDWPEYATTGGYESPPAMAIPKTATDLECGYLDVGPTAPVKAGCYGHISSVAVDGTVQANTFTL